MEEKSLTAECYKETAVRWLDATGHVKNFSGQEKNMFIEMCVAHGLNPFKREIYGIKYKDKFNIVVGYEVYLKKAQDWATRNGVKFSWDANCFDGSGNELSCTCVIKRSDWEEPFRITVWRSEYDQGNSMWASKPRTMLRKVAICQAFRLCFPEELGGIPYSEDEMPSDDAGNVTESVPEPRDKLPYPVPKMERIKELVNSKWDDGTDVLTPNEIEAVRDSISQVGVSKTLEMLESLVAGRRSENAER